MTDWPQTFVLAEEIGRNISVQVGDVIIPEIKIPEPVKTEEIRPMTPNIINHYLNNADQWYEIKIPISCVTWQIKARGNYELLYSYSPAHQTYMTLIAGNVLSADTAPKDIEQSEYGSVFVMCETARVVVELEYWRK